MESITLKFENVVDIGFLCREFEMTKEDLIFFHNQRCGLYDTIPENLPKYINIWGGKY